MHVFVVVAIDHYNECGCCMVSNFNDVSVFANQDDAEAYAKEIEEGYAMSAQVNKVKIK